MDDQERTETQPEPIEPIFERASIPQRLGLFMLISLLAHLTVIIAAFVVHSIVYELPEPLFVRFIVVEPAPIRVPQEITTIPTPEPRAPVVVPEPVAEPEPAVPEPIAEPVEPEPVITEAPAEPVPTVAIAEPEPEAIPITEPTPTEEPTPEHDVAIAETQAAQELPDTTGEMNIASGESPEAAALEPAGEPITTEEEPAEGQEAESLPAEPEVEEPRDGTIDTGPIPQSFVSDRIQGQIVFSEGKGRQLVSTPAGFDFALTQNTKVEITFRINEQGHTSIVRMSPIANRDLEQKIINFVYRMNFTYIPGQVDTATLHMTLTVR